MKKFGLLMLGFCVSTNVTSHDLETITFKQRFSSNVLNLIPSMTTRNDSSEYVFDQLAELKQLYPDKAAYATAISFYNAKAAFFESLGIQGPLEDHGLRVHCVTRGPKSNPLYKLFFGTPKLELESFQTPERLADKIVGSLDAEKEFSLQEVGRVVSSYKNRNNFQYQRFMNVADIEGYEQILHNFYAAHDLVEKAAQTLKKSEERLELKKVEMQKILESATKQLEHYVIVMQEQERRIKEARKMSGIEFVSNVACVPIFIGVGMGLFGSKVAGFFATKADAVAPVSYSSAFLQFAKEKIADYGANKLLDYLTAAAF
jgi:hypothetical protein